MLIYSVVPPRHYTLESCWVEVSFPKGNSHMLRQIGGEDSQQSLLPMSSRPHGLAITPWLLPVHPWSCPPPGGAVSLRWQLLLVMLQGGQAGTRVSSGAVEGGRGPEGGSWVPEPRALVLGSHPRAWLTC